MKSIPSFRKVVWKHYQTHGRHDLPWRNTRNPYEILVSEIMLQQTQVLRVVEKYTEFLKAFPTMRSLSHAEFKDVLKVWSGLGYNRRAKYLVEAARVIEGKHKGNIERALQKGKVPGIGPYTRSAILTFAFNQREIFIETNIRSAFIYYFFPKSKNVPDAKLLPLIEQALVGQSPREWYAALMDYGASIKKMHRNPSRNSAHYTKQSPFKGSLREIRGALLRELQNKRPSVQNLPFTQARVQKALISLQADQLVAKKGNAWSIA